MLCIVYQAEVTTDTSCTCAAVSWCVGQVEGHPAYKNLLESYKGKMNRLTSHVLGVKMPDAAILCGIKLVHDWMPAADDQVCWQA